MLDNDTQTKLDSILAKDISAILPSDIIFLKARISYLTPEQRQKYFGKNVMRVVDVEDDKKPESKGLSYAELKVKAKTLGIKKVVGISKESLLEKIRSVEGKDWM